MGYSKRKEAREIAQYVDESNKRISGITLGQVCANGLVVLNVSCHNCRRRGRYRVTRLIDRYGPGMLLTELRDALAGNCPALGSTNFMRRCGCYFPNVVKKGVDSA